MYLIIPSWTDLKPLHASEDIFCYSLFWQDASDIMSLFHLFFNIWYWDLQRSPLVFPSSHLQDYQTRHASFCPLQLPHPEVCVFWHRQEVFFIMISAFCLILFPNVSVPSLRQVFFTVWFLICKNTSFWKTVIVSHIKSGPGKFPDPLFSHRLLSLINRFTFVL